MPWMLHCASTRPNGYNDCSNMSTFQNGQLFQTSSSQLWVDVILPLAIPRNYSYSVPNDLASSVQPGVRVEVVFGKNKKYAALVKLVSNKQPDYPTKPILSVLDDVPLVYSHQLKLWEWMCEYYLCSEGEVMAAALPAHFKLTGESLLIYNEGETVDFNNLSDDEFLLTEALSIRKQLQISEIQLLLDGKKVYAIVKSILHKNIGMIWESLNEKYKAKQETYVLLNEKYNDDSSLNKLFDDWKGAPKQLQLLLSFLHIQKTEGEVLKSALLKKADASNAQFNALREKGIIKEEKRNIDRIIHGEKWIDIDFQLSADQQLALNDIQQKWEHKNVCLLKGVTGSGKTMLYVKTIEDYIRKGQQVLYLLPEIALTAQIKRRLKKYFGGHLAIYHSKFNDQERVELWNKVKLGEVTVVLGARSSLFLPFQNLGCIIVDEEHDASYKQQDPAPRYNARDAAIFYASLFDAKVLLGSGTPSLESFYNAQQNKYGYVTLNARFGDIKLPEIELVHPQKEKSPDKKYSFITPTMKAEIAATVEQNKQVILFQNRRGYSPYLICGSCGFIPQCNHCDVSLTLHKYSKKLHCHYCGSIYPKLIECTACGSTQWLERNFGTEKIEELIQEAFPQLKVARMDVDSIRGKQAHDKLILEVEKGQIDVLIGTQMVVKGLDFDRVQLVGVLDADGLLSFADFRANERAFQLMEQVSGRAGRKEEKGKVLIQAYQTNHPIVQFVKNHDYEGFYQHEIQSRHEFMYPPFCRLVRITLKHKDEQRCMEAAELLTSSLKKDFKGAVIGPAAPVIARQRNFFLMEMIIKLPKSSIEMARAKKALLHHINLMTAEKRFKSIHNIVDVDPL
jgi:primosomal protein N' (replication factor Y)